MRQMRALIEIVERAYDVDAPTASWLEAIRSSAARVIGDQIATQVYTFAISPEGRFELGAIASEPEWAELLRRAHDQADPTVIREVYLRGPVRSVHKALVGHGDDAGYQAVIGSGLRDITIAIGVDPTGSGCALSFLQRHARPLARATRHALERVSAHLASSRRLRASLDRSGHGVDSLAAGDAILTPGGEVLHAERDARSADARRALRSAAMRIDRARARRGAASPEEALALWRALVEGRWSLVERFESDGRRILVAHRNDPASRAHYRLDERERKVVALLAVGHSLKLCAYELGRAESTVSELALRRCARWACGLAPNSWNCMERSYRSVTSWQLRPLQRKRARCGARPPSISRSPGSLAGARVGSNGAPDDAMDNRASQAVGRSLANSDSRRGA